MALLTTNNLNKIKEDMEKNKTLIEKLTNKNLTQLYESIYNTYYKSECVGIIPITCGNGIISGFAESIFYTLQLVNINAFITKNTDVSGYYEAIDKKADIVIMADDETYLSYNLKNKKMSNNQQATARIYSEILININENIIKGSKFINLQKEVLIIGVGNVGKHAIQTFLNNNYKTYIYDIDKRKLNKLTEQYPQLIIFDFKLENKFLKIFEATQNENTVPESVLLDNTIISTPGIPRALSEILQKKYNINLIMEPLGLGTISMLYEVFENK